MSRFNAADFTRTHTPRNGEFFTIAIDGRGGSGKTSLAKYLEEQLPVVLVMYGDDYFEPVDDPTLWGEFNEDRFINDVIDPLQHGCTFVYKPYDWHTEPHITEQHITVGKVLCLECCYSFAFELDWDLKIWVETPKEICLERGLHRDNELGKERVLKAWNIWQQREDEYIQKTQPLQAANLILDGTMPFSEQI